MTSGSLWSWLFRSMCVCTVCQYTCWLCFPRLHLLCFAEIISFSPLDFFERETSSSKRNTVSDFQLTANSLAKAKYEDFSAYQSQSLLHTWDSSSCCGTGLFCGSCQCFPSHNPGFPVPCFPQSRLSITLPGSPWLSCLSLPPWQGWPCPAIHPWGNSACIHRREVL